MKKINKIALIVIASIVVLGTIFGAVDYSRIKNGNKPLFMVKKYDKNGVEINYYGLGYKASGTLTYSDSYRIESVRFGLWIYTWKIDVKVLTNNSDNEIEYSIKSNYDFKNAKKDGFVVYHNDGLVDNVNKINEFYNNSKNNINGLITIVHYTIEGDPIVHQYHYQDGKYILFRDTTRDKFGQQEIIKKEITDVEIVEQNGKLFLQEK